MDHYQINHAGVIFEVLNSEVIVVNFSTGDYFSLMHSAKYIWQLLDKHIAPATIASLLASHYQQDTAQVLVDLEQFIQALLQEELLVLAKEESQPVPATQLADVLALQATDSEYIAPIVHKYSDVQNLLKIDPVHDVSEAGWPNMPSSFEKTA